MSKNSISMFWCVCGVLSCFFAHCWVVSAHEAVFRSLLTSSFLSPWDFDVSCKLYFKTCKVNPIRGCRKLKVDLQPVRWEEYIGARKTCNTFSVQKLIIQPGFDRAECGNNFRNQCLVKYRYRFRICPHSSWTNLVDLRDLQNTSLSLKCNYHSKSDNYVYLINFLLQLYASFL